MPASISVRLECSQLGDSLRPSHVRLCDLLFNKHILVALAIQTMLHVVVHCIGCVFAAQLLVHRLDILLHDANFLNKVAPVAINSIQLVQHQVEALLQ